MSKLTDGNFKDLLDIFTGDEWAKGNVTRTVKKYCALKNLEYNDSIRRQGSKVLTRGIEKGDSEPIEDFKNHDANILIYDLETSFIEYRGFSLYPNSISHKDITRDWFVLCFSYKWLWEEEVKTFHLTPEEVSKGDDSRIIKELWKLLDRADITVVHNQRFDNRKSNAKFFQYDLKLPSPYKQIDTLIQARRMMALTSNRLDYIHKLLGFEGKVENTTGLWAKVMDGDPEAMESMKIYCEQDIKVLEEVYLKMRPYMRAHPNLGLYIGDDVVSCPTCGSEQLSWDGNSDYVTSVNRYSVFRCKCCGGLGRSKKPIEIGTKNLTVPITGA